MDFLALPQSDQDADNMEQGGKQSVESIPRLRVFLWQLFGS